MLAINDKKFAIAISNNKAAAGNPRPIARQPFDFQIAVCRCPLVAVINNKIMF